MIRAEQSRAEQSRAERSRAEQSRAEQSRAEQSRAEQSRAETGERHEESERIDQELRVEGRKVKRRRKEIEEWRGGKESEEEYGYASLPGHSQFFYLKRLKSSHLMYTDSYKRNLA